MKNIESKIILIHRFNLDKITFKENPAELSFLTLTVLAHYAKMYNYRAGKNSNHDTATAFYLHLQRIARKYNLVDCPENWEQYINIKPWIEYTK